MEIKIIEGEGIKPENSILSILLKSKSLNSLINLVKDSYSYFTVTINGKKYKIVDSLMVNKDNIKELLTNSEISFHKEIFTDSYNIKIKIDEFEKDVLLEISNW